jgi:hypothetical protein
MAAAAAISDMRNRYLVNMHKGSIFFGNQQADDGKNV